MMNDDVNQIVKDLKNPKESIYTNAIAKIPYVANCIGSNSTVYELIPYLTESSIKSEKYYIEVLKALSKIDMRAFSNSELRGMVENLRFFMRFSLKEMKDEMLNLIEKIIDCKNEMEIEEILKEQITNLIILGEKEESITCLKIAQQIFNKYSNKSLNEEINKIAENLFIQDFKEAIAYPPKIVEFIKLCSNSVMFFDDKNNEIIYDYIRSLKQRCVTYSILCEIPRYYLSQYKRSKNVHKCFKNILKMFLNNDYRVKCSVIENVSGLIFQDDAPVVNILSFFIEVLTHNYEDEVHIVVGQQLKHLAKLPKVYSKQILQIINLLSYHVNVHCRETLAKYLVMFIPIFDFNEVIMPIFLHLMDDKYQEVRIIAIESFKSTNIQFEDIVMELFKNEENQRELQMIPSILTKFKDINKLNLIVKKLLEADSNAVRMEMLKYLPEIANYLGEEWKKYFLESVIYEFSQHEDYKLRQLSILIIIKTEYFNMFSKEVFEKALHDTVPSVRLILSQHLPKQYMYIINELKKDSDIDVREYALERFP